MDKDTQPSWGTGGSEGTNANHLATQPRNPRDREESNGTASLSQHHFPSELTHLFSGTCWRPPALGAKPALGSKDRDLHPPEHSVGPSASQHKTPAHSPKQHSLQDGSQ